MAYEKPPCTFNQIDRAGKTFFDVSRSVNDRADAVGLIWDWRTAHSYPLNAIHMTLRNRALRVEKSALTAQRLKRLPSILRKLGRQSTMQMSQMQDIGGCRVILSNMKRIEALLHVYKSSPLRHELNRTRDYIEDPKEDGYRSIHQMYRFSGKATSLPWHRLRIEIQIRTKLQHAWATAVETVDAFTEEDLKFGKGTSGWRRFFQLMGSVHAQIEKTAPVPNTPTDIMKLKEEVRALESDLEVIRKLRSYVNLTENIARRKGDWDWYVIRMMPKERKVFIRGFATKDFAAAKQFLAESEHEFRGSRNQAALVATNSLAGLRNAYPNYFADTTYFTSLLENFVGKTPRPWP